MSVTEWLSEATPERKQVSVCFDRALVSELEEAEQGLLKARAASLVGEDAPTLSEPQINEAKERVEALRERVRAVSHAFVFESIGRRKWRTLLGEHPPTEETKERYGQTYDHNPETFPAAALAASCVEPGLSLEEAQRLIDEAPTVAWFQRIWNACLEANVSGSQDPFVPASDGTRSVTKT